MCHARGSEAVMVMARPGARAGPASAAPAPPRERKGEEDPARSPTLRGVAEHAEINFRPMVVSDLVTFAEWLDRPHVQPWWRPQDLDEVRRAVHGEDPVEPWILVLDGVDAGYFQVYDVAHDPAYAAACASVGVGAGTAGIDYMVSDPARIGNGIGTWAIAQFVRDRVFVREDWQVVCAGPDPANGASIRVLEKNGFRFAGRIDTEWGPEHLMVLTREEWAATTA